MNDEKWNSIDYFLKFTKPIVDMLRSVDIDGSKLHLIDEMWDSMIEKVKKVIFEHEEENLISGRSNFFYIIYDIIVVRWNKSNTPLHCMAFFDSQILSRIMASSREWDSRQAPNEAREISSNRIKCFQRYLKESNELK
uniref:Putative ovule protein n=1 Tax=Solanum chacoense TaxID=4108 RepID=A0A0V0H2R9_SOLCH